MFVGQSSGQGAIEGFLERAMLKAAIHLCAGRVLLRLQLYSYASGNARDKPRPRGVDFQRGHVRLDKRREAVQYFGGQAAVHPHTFDACLVSGGDAQGRMIIPPAPVAQGMGAMTERAARIKSLLRPSLHRVYAL